MGLILRPVQALNKVRSCYFDFSFSASSFWSKQAEISVPGMLTTSTTPSFVMLNVMLMYKLQIRILLALILWWTQIINETAILDKQKLSKSFLLVVAKQGCMLHGVVAVRVVCLIAPLPLVDELAVLVLGFLNKMKHTSTYHPNYWLDVWGTCHLSLGTCVTVCSFWLISAVRLDFCRSSSNFSPMSTPLMVRPQFLYLMRRKGLLLGLSAKKLSFWGSFILKSSYTFSHTFYFFNDYRCIFIY